MAGGELLDKRVDWVSVTKEYLNEIYAKIDRLQHETEELEDRIGTLLFELGDLRISGRSKPAIYRKKKAA